MRTIGAVVGGYVLFAVFSILLFTLSGRDPYAPPSPGFLVAATLYGMAAAALAGFIASAWARRGDLRVSMGLAAVIAAGALISLAASPARGTEGHWTQLAAAVLMAPSAILGGFARRRQRAEEASS
jgi:uncharacterized membrane protein YfcA